MLRTTLIAAIMSSSVFAAPAFADGTFNRTGPNGGTANRTYQIENGTASRSFNFNSANRGSGNANRSCSNGSGCTQNWSRTLGNGATANGSATAQHGSGITRSGTGFNGRTW